MAFERGVEFRNDYTNLVVGERGVIPPILKSGGNLTVSLGPSPVNFPPPYQPPTGYQGHALVRPCLFFKWSKTLFLFNLLSIRYLRYRSGFISILPIKPRRERRIKFRHGERIDNGRHARLMRDIAMASRSARLPGVDNICRMD